MALTLEELKAQNAKSEEETAEPESAPEAEESEEEAVDDESPEPEESAETKDGDGDGEESDTESWMQEEDEQASDSGKAKFGDSDIAAAKRKLRAKLERQHSDEMEQLKAEIEALKRGGQSQSTQKAPAREMPTLEKFDYDEGKYAAAMQEWVMSLTQNASKSEAEQQRQARFKQEQDQSVESHYERAARLAKEHSIADEVYQSADHTFRSAIETAMPGQGDTVADYLIAQIGEGSEKIAYQVGRNASKAAKLTELLRSDPSGLKATLYLGELKGQLNSPLKRTSKAPRPAKRAEGGNTGGDKEAQMRRKYQSESDLQKRFDMRRQAKQAGIDVSQW